MHKLTAKNQLLIGLTLFSMFFGAGNLIFPPSLGAQAGQNALAAFAGFAVSAIGLPVLGVAAVARTGGLKPLAGRVGRVFAMVYTMLIYLSIGPCLAIPRTASTSFEMAVTPFLRDSMPAALPRAVYSAVFFGAALLLALRPGRLQERLGKRLGPLLLALIAVLFFAGLFSGLHGAPAAQEAYRGTPAVRGFLDGYQTMDAIAALIFGIVLALNIRACGLQETPDVVRATIGAGWVAAALFALVYGALTWLGTVAAANCAVPAQANGAVLLTTLADRLFGRVGQGILAAIFVIACLNTCIGLICCCGEYFHRLMPKVPYAAWAAVFAVISALLANVGLDAILKFSVPVLICLYPVAIVLTALAFLPDRFAGTTFLYPAAAGCAGAAGLVQALSSAKLTIPVVTGLFGRLPLADVGLAWLPLAVLGGAVGLLIRRRPVQR